jgi:hypothetical protein
MTFTFRDLKLVIVILVGLAAIIDGAMGKATETSLGLAALICATGLIGTLHSVILNSAELDGSDFDGE